MEAGGKLFGVNQLLTEDSLNRKKKKKVLNVFSILVTLQHL